VGHLDLQAHEQGDLLVGLVVAPLGRAKARAVLDERHLPRVAGVGQDGAPLQRQETHLLVGLEAVLMAELIRQRRRDVRGSLVESAIALLGAPNRSRRGVRLQLGPQRLGGGSDLAGHRTRQLRRQAKVGADVVARALLQGHLVAQLAVREGLATHVVQRIAVRQLGLAQRADLLRCRVQSELGGQDGVHAASRS